MRVCVCVCVCGTRCFVGGGDEQRVAATENLDVYQQAIYSVALLLVNLTLIGLTLWSMLQNVLAKPKVASFDHNGPSMDRQLTGDM